MTADTQRWVDRRRRPRSRKGTIKNRGKVKGGNGNSTNGTGGWVYATASKSIAVGADGLQGGEGSQPGEALPRSPVVSYQVVYSGSGPVYLSPGWGVIREEDIDGAVTSEETGDPFLQAIPVDVVGGALSYPAIIYMKQDGESLYLAVKITELPYESVEELLDAGCQEVFVGFDVNEDGEQWTVGDDLIMFDLVEEMTVDAFYPADLQFAFDTRNGGTNDVIAAAGFDSGTLTVEFLRPLISEDAPEMDPALEPDAEVRVRSGFILLFEFAMEDDLVISIE